MPSTKRAEKRTCPNCGREMKPRSKSPGGKTRWECRYRQGGQGEVYCYSTTSPESARRPYGSGERPKIFRRKLDEGAKVYLITAAQNATPVRTVFWGCLKTAAEHLNAERIVVPFRYKNPTSRWTASQANEEWWAPEVAPFLWNARKVLNSDLVLMADIPIQPTADKPLDGFEAISGAVNAIFGHAKLELRCVAVPANHLPKIITTTGACTVPNYTHSKAGKKGGFHHTTAALIVEVSGATSHIRQLNFDEKTQSFTDLDTRYYEDHVEKAPRALALVQGDTHVDFVSKNVERATFGPKGIVETLRPERIVWHDLLDSYSVNPHHRGRPFIAIAKEQSGRNDMRAEVERACRFVRERTQMDVESVVVPSNHDDMFDRWIENADWRTDPTNAVFYLETALAMAKGTRFEPTYGAVWPSALPMTFPKMVDMKGIKPLRHDEPYSVRGIAVGMHGDRGPKGARGSINNHRRLGVKCFIGHSHSPGIAEGAYQVGTSTDLLEYAKGPNDWRNCHGVINADGKRQLIFIVDGEWRGKPAPEKKAA